MNSEEELIESISMSDSYSQPGFSPKYFNASDLEKSKTLILEFLQRYTNAEEFSQKKQEDERLVRGLTNALVAVAILDPHKAEEIAKSYLQYDDPHIQSAAIRALSLSGRDGALDTLWTTFQKNLDKIPNNFMTILESNNGPDSAYTIIGIILDETLTGILASSSKKSDEYKTKSKDIYFQKFNIFADDRKKSDEWDGYYMSKVDTRKRMDEGLRNNLERAMQSPHPTDSDLSSRTLGKL